MSADPTATPSLQVRYDVLLRENTRLQGVMAAMQKELDQLRQVPDTRPKTTEGDAAAEIADLKVSVIAFAGPWAAQWARDHGLPDGHLHPQHYDLLARCGARMDNFVRGEVPGG